MLSVEDDLSQGTKWLRTKLGFSDDREGSVRFPSEVARSSIVWSPVMQFTGSLDYVGALIFIYEGPPPGAYTGKPDTRSLLHEVIRQTGLQSQYQFPVLVIRFDEAGISNASDVTYLIILFNSTGSARLGSTVTLSDVVFYYGVSSSYYRDA
jgi:hypothetical protein